MPHPRPLYSFFYSHLERNPEWGRFRRFTKEWAWMLNDNVHEIQAHMKACNAEVTRICGDRHSITDYHRAQANGPQLGLDRQILHFKTLLRQHAQDSITYHQLVGLPDQPTEFARSFPGWELFENGVYVPTGEDAADYEQVSAGPEFFAGREPEPIDHLTRCIIWLNYSIRAWYDKKRHVVRDDLKSINSESNKRIMHLVAAIYMSIFLSGTLGTLSVLSSEKRRIVVLGILGLVLQVSLVLLIPGLKRNDMVAILAAYFAVGGIYIGTKSNITS